MSAAVDLLAYAPKVVRLAAAAYARSSAEHRTPVIDYNDLVQDAWVGAIEAAERFDPERGVGFGAFAAGRISGAVADALRRIDPVSRQTRSAWKHAKRAAEGEAQRLGRAAGHSETAQAAGVSRDEYERMRVAVTAAEAVDPDLDRSRAPEAVDERRTPAELAMAAVDAGRAIAALERTRPRWAYVVRRYYFDHVPMHAIGREIGCNEARISQIHKAALGVMRQALGEPGALTEQTP